MRLVELEEIVKSALIYGRTDLICHYAINYMLKLIEIAKIAKEHVEHCGDGSWFDPDLEQAIRKLEE